MEDVRSNARKCTAAASHYRGEQRPNALKKMDLKYCDYDLSKMKDQKGGFILEEQPKPTEEETEAKINVKMDKEALLRLDPSCESCKSHSEIDINYLYYFRVPVCSSCKKSNSDRYALLTKTECRMVRSYWIVLLLTALVEDGHDANSS